MQCTLIVEDLPDIRQWMADTVKAAFPRTAVVAVGRCEEGIRQALSRSFNLALIDMGLPDGRGLQVVQALRSHQPQAVPVVVSIHDADEHVFPALQRIQLGEPPLSPAIARRVLNYFARNAARPVDWTRPDPDEVALNTRETEILQRVAKGYTLPEIAVQLGLSRHTVADYVKQIYRKLNVSSRAEAALEAARRGLVRP
jgi:DNA-binding NarL/FixJ family response regulator